MPGWVSSVANKLPELFLYEPDVTVRNRYRLRVVYFEFTGPDKSGHYELRTYLSRVLRTASMPKDYRLASPARWSHPPPPFSNRKLP